MLTYKYYLHCSLSSKSDLCLRSYLKVKWCVAAGHKARQEEKDSCLEKNSHRFLKKCTYVGHFTVVLHWKNGSLKFFLRRTLIFLGIGRKYLTPPNLTISDSQTIRTNTNDPCIPTCQYTYALTALWSIQNDIQETMTIMKHGIYMVKMKKDNCRAKTNSTRRQL